MFVYRYTYGCTAVLSIAEPFALSIAKSFEKYFQNSSRHDSKITKMAIKPHLTAAPQVRRECHPLRHGCAAKAAVETTIG